MNKKMTALMAIWPCFALNSALAQINYSLSGKIRDSKQSPLPAAMVALHQGKDSVAIKTAFSDTAGHFLFDQLKEGAYYIEVDAAGYIPYQSNFLALDSNHVATEVEPVTLLVNTGQLREVEVAAKKVLIVRRADRTIVNVDALISAAGGTALDVLQKSPGVQVDQNGNISMKGKQGINVLIDDKPSYLSGEDLANYLRSLPSSSLDQIELMTNPPAQYDAAGTGGIINIRLKRNRAKGMNGGLNLSANQGQRTRSNNSGNFNYRNNKISVFANAGYNLNNSFTDLDLNRVYKQADNTPEAYFEQNSYFKRHGNIFSLNAGTDYSLSKKTTLGMVLTSMYRASTQVNDNTSHVLGAMRETDSVIVAHNTDDIDFKNGGINLNYRTRFDEKGHGLTADADFLTYRNHTEQAYENKGYRPDNTLSSQDMVIGHLPARIDIYSVKTDYILPLPFKWQLAAGGKYSNIHTDNTADYSTTVGSITSPDYDKSNQFIYKESIAAAYLNLNKDMGNLSLQAGLRLEHTSSNGHQLGNVQKPDSSFSRDYTNLFPTLYLSYKFDSLSTHQLGLNYGRRIERPYYQDLNPFLYPMDKFTYYTGNPFLKPAFVQSIELSHTYKNKITTTLSYSRSRDDVNETIEIAKGIYYSRPGNIGSKNMMSVSVNGTLDPAKWLNLNIYTEYTNIASKSDFYNGMLNTSGSFWLINGDARITPAKGWDVELSGFYRTRIFDAQFIIGSFWMANIAVQKKVSNAITLKLGVNDLFYTQVIRGTITNLSNADAGWVNRSDSRNVVFSFSYRFGKAFNNDSKHDASGADAEKNRVKN